MSELYELFSQHPRISTDTRRIEPDSIFFALRGDTFDGQPVSSPKRSKKARPTPSPTIRRSPLPTSGSASCSSTTR